MDFTFVIIPVVMAVIFFFAFRPLWKSRMLARQLAKTGKPELGSVVSVSQTGTTINSVPLMAVTVDIHAAGEPPRRILIKQLMQLGNIPSVGDMLYVIVDPAKPDEGLLAGAAPKPQPQATSNYAFTAANAPASQQGQTEQQRLDLLSISPILRERGKPAIATVLAIRPQQAPNVTFDLEIDAIGAPKRKVTITQAMFGEAYQTGERLYLLVDPDNPQSMAILPLSAVGGQHLPHSMNRLDAIVLGPQILQVGAKAKGTVTDVKQIPLGDPALEAKGYTRYHLKVHIVPDNGSAPYDAEQDLSFIRPERAARIAVVGAEVPIRYDPEDPQCFATDSFALGYPDPYAQVQADMKAILAAK